MRLLIVQLRFAPRMALDMPTSDIMTNLKEVQWYGGSRRGEVVGGTGGVGGVGCLRR